MNRPPWKKLMFNIFQFCVVLAVINSILAKDFISRLRPRIWDPRPRTLLSTSKPRPLLFVFMAPCGQGQVLENASPVILVADY